MRTRMPGGMAGAQPTIAAPYANVIKDFVKASAAPVGRAAPGRAQHGYVVMLLGIENCKAQGHDAIDEHRVCQARARAFIEVGDVEVQLILADRCGLGREHRLVGSAVGVGGHALDHFPATVLVTHREVDAHSGARAAGKAVEHMG